jgi:hypothetical protein
LTAADGTLIPEVLALAGSTATRTSAVADSDYAEEALADLPTKLVLRRARPA